MDKNSKVEPVIDEITPLFKKRNKTYKVKHLRDRRVNLAMPKTKTCPCCHGTCKQTKKGLVYEGAFYNCRRCEIQFFFYNEQQYLSHNEGEGARHIHSLKNTKGK